MNQLRRRPSIRSVPSTFSEGSTLALRTAAVGGPRRAALTSLGIAVGCFSWATPVAVGLGALLAASQMAYTTLRWIGAAYLVYIGYRMLRNPRQSFLPESRNADIRRRAFTTGVLTNLLNPKVGVFYVSFLPQFVPQGVPVAPYILLLGAIHALLGHHLPGAAADAPAIARK
jgi:threonine/homoserine/homoserine lactone efflux protein